MHYVINSFQKLSPHECHWLHQSNCGDSSLSRILLLGLGDLCQFIQSHCFRCQPGPRTSAAAAWRHSDDPFRCIVYWLVADGFFVRMLLFVAWLRRRLLSRVSVRRRWRWLSRWRLWRVGARLPDCVQRRPAGGVCSWNNNRFCRSNRDLLRQSWLYDMTWPGRRIAGA
jgi:hypothetical protein